MEMPRWTYPEGRRNSYLDTERAKDKVFSYEKVLKDENNWSCFLINTLFLVKVMITSFVLLASIKELVVLSDWQQS